MQVEQPMDLIEKAVSRQLRKRYDRLPRYTSNENYTKVIFEIAEFASQLIPFWLESDHSDLQAYLYHQCGFTMRRAGKLALWTLTYYEIPSLSIWLEIGWREAARAATRDQEGQKEMLLQGGLNVLDLMTLI